MISPPTGFPAPRAVGGSYLDNLVMAHFGHAGVEGAVRTETEIQSLAGKTVAAGIAGDDQVIQDVFFIPVRAGRVLLKAYINFKLIIEETFGQFG